MQTQSHVLLALAVLAKKNNPKRNRIIFLGALIPDAFIYVAWAYYTLRGNTQSHIWDVLYFQNPTQFWDALFNSIPIFATLAVGAWLGMRIEKYRYACSLVLLFALAALVHIASDIPVHASDAHRHFWPISDWRFYSPFSYWEPEHYSMPVTIIEACLGLMLCKILWERFPKKWVHCVLGALVVFYAVILIGVLLFMTGVLGNSP